jgi:hypothetical protein
VNKWVILFFSVLVLLLVGNSLHMEWKGEQIIRGVQGAIQNIERKMDLMSFRETTYEARFGTTCVSHTVRTECEEGETPAECDARHAEAVQTAMNGKFPPKEQ